MTFIQPITIASSVPTSGTVTSVGLVAPNIFTVVGSPITSSGTFTLI
jgi:ABC-type Fe3+-siderophore transport system permease subunit